MVKISRDSRGPASAHEPADVARRPSHRRLAGPRDGAAQLLRPWILTDPALERRIGIGRGLGQVGPAPAGAAGASARASCRALDLLLLSHAHMDHTDLGTLRCFARDVPVVVQRGNRDLVRRFHRVDELDWGESVELDGHAGGIGRGAATGARAW